MPIPLGNRAQEYFKPEPMKSILKTSNFQLILNLEAFRQGFQLRSNDLSFGLSCILGKCQENKYCFLQISMVPQQPKPTIDDSSVPRRFEGWWHACLKGEVAHLKDQCKVGQDGVSFNIPSQFISALIFRTNLMPFNPLRQKRDLEKQVGMLVREAILAVHPWGVKCEQVRVRLAHPNFRTPLPGI